METVKATKYKNLPNGEPFDPVKIEAIIQSVLTGKKPDEHFYKVKVFLYQVNDAKRRVQILKNQVQYRKNALEYITPSHYDAPKANGDLKSNANLCTDEVAALKGRLHKAEENLARITVVVSDVICQLKDVNQQTVLQKRYIEGKRWNCVAAEMDHSVRWVQKLHGRALPQLEKILERMDGTGETRPNEGREAASPVNIHNTAPTAKGG